MNDDGARKGKTGDDAAAAAAASSPRRGSRSNATLLRRLGVATTFVVTACVALNLSRAARLSTALIGRASETARGHFESPPEEEAAFETRYSTPDPHLEESSVLRAVLRGSVTSLAACRSSSSSSSSSASSAALPLFGVANALSEWSSAPPDRRTVQPREPCRLPPPTSCDARNVTVVLFDGRDDRRRADEKTAEEEETDETRAAAIDARIRELAELSLSFDVVDVALVWDGDAPYSEVRNVTAINESGGGARVRVSDLSLRRRPSDLSRRDPTLVRASSGEAVLLLDWRRDVASRASALSAAWDLWRRGSDRWVGTRGRRARLSTPAAATSASSPFVPVCRSDAARYDWLTSATASTASTTFFVPDSDGSFSHRDWFCWTHHPAFEEARRYVDDRPADARADESYVAAVIGQLSGKGGLSSSSTSTTTKSTNSATEGRRRGRRLADPSLSSARETAARRGEEELGVILGYFGSLAVERERHVNSSDEENGNGDNAC